MCASLASSKEHVPPICFFPEHKGLPPGKDYRKNLITVPSCDLHNSRKSEDDQYLLFVIASYYETNLVAQQHFSKNILPAIKERPMLIKIFSREYFPVTVNGLPTIAYKVDKNRFNNSIDHIARAIYFHHFRQKMLEPISIVQLAELSSGKNEDFLRNYLRQELKFKDFQMAPTLPKYGQNQEIFYYQVIEDKRNKKDILRLVFYEGFVAIAYPSFLPIKKCCLLPSLRRVE
jgi:hypothetical protein